MYRRYFTTLYTQGLGFIIISSQLHMVSVHFQFNQTINWNEPLMNQPLNINYISCIKTSFLNLPIAVI